MAASVEWAPKIGLNSYMLEFLIPYAFFERWYSHLANPSGKSELVSVDEIAQSTQRVGAEIVERGLTYHATGHGWTYEPFSIPGLEWVPGEFDIEGRVSELLAKVDGRRALHEGIPLNTNLCYSSAEAGRLVVAYAVRYAREHPEVGMHRVWLADNSNNYCACADCREALPSDLYIRLPNEMDEAFTEDGIEMRITFIVYLELPWPPEHERLSNPDRFSLLFAPISRSYSRLYETATSGVTLLDYVRNRTSPRRISGRTWPTCMPGSAKPTATHSPTSTTSCGMITSTRVLPDREGPMRGRQAAAERRPWRDHQRPDATGAFPRGARHVCKGEDTVG